MDEEFKRPAKRKASHKCPLNVPLPRWVSKWKRCHLRLLNIYYAEDFLNEPLDVLSKIPSLIELNKCQKDYIREANQFLKFEASVEKLQLHGSVVKSAISKLYIDMEKQPENKCCKGQETSWRNLAHCTVISEPDFRFFKTGLEQRKTDIMVTVVEVKNDIKGRKRSKRSRSNEYSSDGNYPSDSSSSSSVASSSCSFSSLTESNQEADLPLIERITNTRVLGQHGGELLLDLNRYQGSRIESELTMPGMIIDQTKVIFTLLIMSRNHLEKLKSNQLLLNDDRAVIYYSKPLDILSEESRSILIENFMRLNNI